MDIKIKDGDVFLDETGAPVYIDGIEEVLQQVLICITAQKGGFIYNKDLGCCAVTDVSGEREVRRLEARLREAVIPLENVQLWVNSAWELVDGTVLAEITVSDGTQQIITEVIL